MKEYLVLISCAAFIAFLVPSGYRKYFAMAGWISIVAYLFTELPYFFSLNNFLYPAIAIISIPFLYITVRSLADEKSCVQHLSRAAAVAFLIYAPFAYIEPLGNWLISTVLSQTIWILDLFHYPITRLDWNMIAKNGLLVEIILACTGIQSMAIMLGVAAAVPTTRRQKAAAFMLVVPTIYILNLLRNAFVVMAYTGQWFPYLPEIAGNGEYGFESFFWAHNVICELLALIALIAIAYGLFLLIPGLGTLAEELYDHYRREIMGIVYRDR